MSIAESDVIVESYLKPVDYKKQTAIFCSLESLNSIWLLSWNSDRNDKNIFEYLWLKINILKL